MIFIKLQPFSEMFVTNDKVDKSDWCDSTFTDVLFALLLIKKCLTKR